MSDYLASTLVKKLRGSSSIAGSAGNGTIYELVQKEPEMIFQLEHNSKVKLKSGDLIKNKRLDPSDFIVGDRFYTVKISEGLYLLVCKVDEL